MVAFRWVLPALISCLFIPGCDVDQLSGPDDPSWTDSITIYRDAYGVPHIHGRTDAAAAFGFAYAQAEDNFWQVEDNFIRAIGRASEVYGDETLQSDWMNRALQITSLSISEFEQSDDRLQELLTAFAAGFNHYLRTHPEIKPRLLQSFEPWFPLAFIRYLYYQRGFARASGLRASDLASAMDESGDIAGIVVSMLDSGEPDLLPKSEQGSNSWAVTGKKSASGNALLFINPHLPFFGSGQVYEGHVISDEGWNFSGYTRFGFPMPYVGFNSDLGWASTDNGADLSDLYEEKFDRPDDPLAYKYGEDYRTATLWTEHIIVVEDGVLDTLSFTMRKTHHGPIVGSRHGKPLALRMAKFEDPGWLDQWYAMTRARTFEDFKEAASRLDMLFGNYLYADREGNIYYVYNGAVPRRSGAFDWGDAVDGSDPETEWQGYHSLEEIPQVLNPPSGWIQNCNGTPFLSTAAANPTEFHFPDYMVMEGSQAGARTRAARQILSGNDSFTFETWAKLAYDTFVITADEEIPGLVTDWTRLRDQNPSRAEKMREAVELLRDWDRISTIESEAMTLFITASEQSALSVRGIERAMSSLERDWGTWHVPWGDINRLQRVRSNGKSFSDDNPSIPVAGVPSWAGSMFTVWSPRAPGQKRRYGTGGNSYVSVIEFGPTIRARSLHTFGASANPESPHHFDQASIYATGDFKEAWVSLQDVVNNAARSYHPGGDDLR